MSVHYNNDFKKEVVKEYKSGAKTITEIAAEFNIAKSTVSEWAKKYSEECQYTTSNKSNVDIVNITLQNKLVYKRSYAAIFSEAA